MAFRDTNVNSTQQHIAPHDKLCIKKEQEMMLQAAEYQPSNNLFGCSLVADNSEATTVVSPTNSCNLRPCETTSYKNTYT